MVDIIHVYERLKENYGDLEISLEDGEIVVFVEGHKITANVSSAVLSRDGETVLEQAPSDSDELYLQIEQLIDLARAGGATVFVSEKNKKSLNPTYKSVRKRQEIFEIILSILFLLLSLYELFLYILNLNSDFSTGLWVLAELVIYVVIWNFVHKRIFKAKWVCPNCGAALPVKKVGLGRVLVYTAACPHCGENLETGKNVEASWDKFGVAKAMYSKLQWSEADELPMHRHMDAVRRDAIVLALFAALCDIVSIATVYFVDTDAIPREILVITIVFLPLLAAIALYVYYFLFAPLFIAGSKPKNATDEWKRKHIRFPIVTLLITVLWTGVPCSGWLDKQQIVNPVWFYGMWGAATVALCAALLLRTPKRLRWLGNLTTLLLFATFIFGIVLMTDLNAFLVKEEREYQAEVVDTVGIIRDNDKINYYVAVVLENGKTVKIKTDEELCREATQTRTVTVCQTESYLGVTSVSIEDG